MHLDAERPTLEQLYAFRYGLDLLSKETLTSEDFDACHRRLLDVGLPPRFTLGNEVVQSYIDESYTLNG